MTPPPFPINLSTALPTTLLTTITSHAGPVNALAFSALGGTYLLTGSSDRAIHLSRTSPASDSPSPAPVESKTIQKYSAHGYAVLDIACASDNKSFASVGGDRSVFLWDVQTAQTTRRFGGSTNLGHQSKVNAVEFAGEGDSLVVSGGDDRSVRIWDCRSRDAKPVMVLEEARDGISCLAIPKAGGEIIAGSVDERVRGYDVRTGKCSVDVVGASVTSVSVTRDGGAVLVGSLDSTIRLLDRRDGGLLQGFGAEEQGGETYVNTGLRLKSCLAGLSEGLVLSGSEGDGRVRCWDVLSGKMMGSLEVSEAGKVVSVIAWREGGKGANGSGEVWAAGGADGIVRVYGRVRGDG